ncbi:MAG: hypothetical protein NTX50_03695 [Candidatus Sumerlaeota bacterium]|nr:hypothetical protein [Candidatus Sumerlaeota bacterium]
MKTTEHLEGFKKTAEQFGAADEATLKFRQQCINRGVLVAFRAGQTRDQTLELLDDPLTKEIIKDPAAYQHRVLLERKRQ